MIRNWLLKTSDALFGPPACSLIAALLSLRGRAKAPSSWTPGMPRRILVIRPGGLGDMILLLPFLEVLAKTFPSAELDVVCEQRNLPVLALSHVKARCLPYDRNPIAFLWKLIWEHYDIALDTEQFHHSSAVFAALSGAPVRIGFNINPRRNGLYTHLIPYSPDEFEGDQFLRLLAPLDIGETPFHPALIRPVNPYESLPADLCQKLQDHQKAGRRLIIIHSGGSVRRKILTAEKLAELVVRLAGQPENAVVVLGSKADSRRTAAIENISGRRDNVLYITAGLNLSQCAALISMAGIFVGPDSGLLHLAAACNVATVAVFGPSDHKKWGYGGRGRHVVVRNAVPCAPCFIFGYSKPCRHYECIEGISVDDLAGACSSIAKA